MITRFTLQTSGPHDSRVNDDFEEYWSALDIELALRSEAYLRPGVGTDETLQVAATEFGWWVKRVLDESLLGDHG